MLKRIGDAFFIIIFVLGVCKNISAQPRGPFFNSPELNDDNSVTFRYLAPAAKEVLLSGQFLDKTLSMTKGSQGIWSVTVESIEPDIYPYSFIVDGTTVMDPANVAYFPNERFKGSLIDVPGEKSIIHSMENVPHGTITYEYYNSVEETTGRLVVYTPPGYASNKEKQYPVFYLISGTTDTEETWFKVGRANLILDNLIAQGKAKPMIIVMPYGNIEARIAKQKGGSKPLDPRDREGEEALNRARTFEIDLVTNIIPHIEKNYKVLSGRNSRAIGGFSRGGGQTLRSAFNNLDKFSWICCYSAYLSPKEMKTDYSFIYKDPSTTNEKLNLFGISVGNKDFLYPETVEFMEFLKEKNIKFNSLVTSGGHTWMNTKKYLTESAQLLFK